MTKKDGNSKLEILLTLAFSLESFLASLVLFVRIFRDVLSCGVIVAIGVWVESGVEVRGCVDVEGGMCVDVEGRMCVDDDGGFNIGVGIASGTYVDVENGSFADVDGTCPSFLKDIVDSNSSPGEVILYSRGPTILMNFILQYS